MAVTKETMNAINNSLVALATALKAASIVADEAKTAEKAARDALYEKATSCATAEELCPQLGISIIKPSTSLVLDKKAITQWIADTVFADKAPTVALDLAEAVIRECSKESKRAGSVKLTTKFVG